MDSEEEEEIQILPRGWTSYDDPMSGRRYYHNMVTGVSQLELPGWRMPISPVAAAGGGGAADQVLYTPRGPTPRGPNDHDREYGWGDFDFDLDALFPPPARASVPVLPQLPPHAARAAINHQDGECPITMDSLSDLLPKDKSVTTCAHVFEGAALAEWLKKSTQCPQCKSECELNPTYSVPGRPTHVPRHIHPSVVRASICKKGSSKNVKAIPRYPVCIQCGQVVKRIPCPNICPNPRCRKINAFSGGSRKHKHNIRGKSKKLIKRKKTIKRR